MIRRKVPQKIISFMARMLTDREMNLRFDDYISEAISLDNGIGQGDPLSMGLYQYYNADLLDILAEPNQLAIAYVNDAILYMSGSTFEETHKDLINMMMKEKGVIDWSMDHNSPLESSKLALIDFSHHSCRITRPNLILPHGTVEPKPSVKYLGVILNQHLNWALQYANIIEKGSNWTTQIRRVTRPGWGITPKYARKLYIGVALPKILYRADVWYMPPPARKSDNRKRRKGIVKITKKLTSIQRAGTLTITGGLCTSPTDTLDALANTLPIESTIEKWCFRAAVRLASLPDWHPVTRGLRIGLASTYVD
jgi:hypothetical protein